MTAIDALALSMLAVLLASFGVVMMLFLNMARHASRRDPELEQLMEDADRLLESREAPVGSMETPREPWERDGDWWRRED